MPEDRIHVQTAAAVVVDAVPVARERAVTNQHAGSGEYRQSTRAVFRVVLDATLHADHVDTGVADVPYEQAIVDLSETAAQQIDG